MCVEAAVCYAMGEPNSDEPSCVHHVVRSIKITLNDAGPWRSDKDRGNSLKRVAIAQLGTHNWSPQQEDIFNSEFERQILLIVTPHFQKLCVKSLKGVKDLKDFTNHVDDFLENLMYCDFDERYEWLQDHVVKNKKARRALLLDLVDALETALKKAKAPGCKFLYLAK